MHQQRNAATGASGADEQFVYVVGERDYWPEGVFSTREAAEGAFPGLPVLEYKLNDPSWERGGTDA